MKAERPSIPHPGRVARHRFSPWRSLRSLKDLPPALAAWDHELSQPTRPATIRLTLGALIAALYVALVFALQFASFGPIQLRLAEALTVLPLIFPEAPLALGIGCLLANVLGNLGPWDIFGGSAVTLLAALLTRLLRYRPALALASPVLLNALLVSLYLHGIYAVPYWPTVASIGVSEAVVVYVVGWPLLLWLAGRRRGGVGR